MTPVSILRGNLAVRNSRWAKVVIAFTKTRVVDAALYIAAAGTSTACAALRMKIAITRCRNPVHNART
jgi:hypothetical protein